MLTVSREDPGPLLGTQMGFVSHAEHHTWVFRPQQQRKHYRNPCSPPGSSGAGDAVIRHKYRLRATWQHKEPGRAASEHVLLCGVVTVISHQQTWQQNQNRLDHRVNLKEATRDKSEHHRAAGRSTRTRTRTHWHIQVRQSHRAAFRLMKLSLRFFRNCNPEAAPGGVHQTDVKRGDVSFRLEFR